MDSQIAEQIAESITERWGLKTVLTIEENAVEDFPDTGTVTVVWPDDSYFFIGDKYDFSEFCEYMDKPEGED